jgi:F-type H+-transporting ATPase subunit c
MTPAAYHYLALGTVLVLPLVGVGIGQGKISKAALDAINRQPAAYEAIYRLSVIALSLNETSALLSVLTALFMFNSGMPAEFSWLGDWGIVCAVGLPALAVGLGASLPACESLYAVARQPFAAANSMTLMLIAQSFIQTPVIFGFILSFLIRGQLSLATNLAEGLRLFAAGLALGIGAVGPTFGLSRFAQAACYTLGINKHIYHKIRTFTFLSQALIEAPIVFALLIALIIGTLRVDGGDILPAIALLSAAIAMGFSTAGAGISSGNVAAAACRQIALKPDLYTIISRVSIPTQTFIDTSPVYGLVLALFLYAMRLR